MSKTLLFLAARHGQTELNAAGCFRGHNNIPLDSHGIRDAHQLAKFFKPIELSHIICSDKIRSHETARIIAAEKEMPVHPTPNLHAWDVGEFSGKPKDKENLAALQWYIDNPDEVIPAGESLNAFKARVRPCYKEAAEIADYCGAPVLLVIHSSNIHEIGSMLYGDHNSVLVQPGGVVAVSAQDDRLVAESIYKGRKPSGRTADTIS